MSDDHDYRESQERSEMAWDELNDKAEKLAQALEIVLKSHDRTCKPEECQMSGIDLARQVLADYRGE